MQFCLIKKYQENKSKSSQNLNLQLLLSRQCGGKNVIVSTKRKWKFAKDESFIFYSYQQKTLQLLSLCMCCDIKMVYLNLKVYLKGEIFYVTMFTVNYYR